MAALDDLTNAGIPVPSIYASESGAADKAYQDALSTIAQQQALTAQKYGFNVSADPNTGAIQDTRIDPTQQYSAVMNMLGSQSGALRSLREGLSGQGLTGGGLKGLAAQRAALLKFQQQGQVAGLGQQFTQNYGDLENQKAGALATRNQGYNQAAMDAINQAISQGLFNQAPAQAPMPIPDYLPPTLDTGGGGGGGGDNNIPPAPTAQPTNIAGYAPNTSYAQLGVAASPINVVNRNTPAQQVPTKQITAGPAAVQSSLAYIKSLGSPASIINSLGGNASQVLRNS